MEKVALVYLNRTRPPLFSLGLEYLGAALRREGFEVEVLDLCLAEDPERAIRDFFSRDEFFAVGVNLRNLDDMSVAVPRFFLGEYREMVELIKKHTSAPLILGGPAFTLVPKGILDFMGVEMGIRGEGEESLPLLLKKMRAGEPLDDVPGLVLRRGARVLSNPPKPLNLADLPTPARGILDVPRYFREGGIAFVEARRGCDKKCIYCPDPWIKTPPLRFRSPESVVREIEVLAEMGVDHIYFSDSEFNAPDEEFACEICRRMIERKLHEKIQWYVDILPVPFSEEFCKLLRRAGCAGVAFNIDVCCDRMLRNIKRDFTVEEIRAAAEIAHRNELPFVFYLLFGMPGEDRETVRESIENLKRLPAEGFETVLGVRVIPGTELAEMIKREGPLSQNPGVYGEKEDNEDLLKPVFYISPQLGPEPEARAYIADLIGDDERFFFRRRSEGPSEATFGSNELLVKAIEMGYRGIHWDILRKLAHDGIIDKLRAEILGEAR